MSKLLAVLLLLVACKDSTSKSGSPAPSGPPKPLTITFTNNELKADEVEGQVIASGTNVSMTVFKSVAGLKYKLGDKQGTMDKYGSNVDVDVKDRLGGTTLDDLAKFDPNLTLELTFPDGRTGSAKVPPVDFKFGLHDLLKKAENGPVLFGTEPDDPNKTDSLLFLSYLDLKVIGKAGKLSEVDYIALARLAAEPKAKKTCSGYQDSNKKPMPDITLLEKETTATIYDRRTGNVVETKVFPPDDGCPMFTMQKEGETTTDSHIPTEKIEDWLRTKVKR